MSAGTVVWITGLPSSGKSTFAEQLLAALRRLSSNACVLDGDAVRKCLVPTPGYAGPDRANFYQTLAQLAALLAAQGLLVLVPATANRRAFRDRARALAPTFVEVWVATALAECQTRDTKGLYAQSRSGQAGNVPGADEAYEPPANPDVIAQGGADPEALAAVLARLRRLGIIPPA
jgi:adenylylsulfate kinase